MSRRRGRKLLGAVAVCGLLIGCTPPASEPAATPAAPSSVTITPRETALERQQREDFEQAEAQYRKFMAEYERLSALGRSRRASSVMRSTATGKYLELYESLLRSQQERNVQFSEPTRIGYVKRGAYSAEQLTLEVCEDASRSRVIRAGKDIGRGRILKRSLYVRKYDGVWKIWNGDERGQPKSCDD